MTNVVKDFSGWHHYDVVCIIESLVNSPTAHFNSSPLDPTASKPNDVGPLCILESVFLTTIRQFECAFSFLLLNNIHLYTLFIKFVCFSTKITT